MNAAYNPNQARNARIRQGLAAPAFLCAIVLALPLAGGEGDANATAACGMRAQDRVWLASTRHLGCVNGSSGPALWRWNAAQWQASDQQEFLDQNEELPHTVIYIHGNRVGDDEGASGGLAVYQQIVASHADEKPVRFVIWSWPSTKICGPIKDVRSKAWRSDDEAVMLARFLDGIHKPEAPAEENSDFATFAASAPKRDRSDREDYRVGFVAFSYGARITGGALQMLGGGNLDGHTLPRRQRPQFRVALWAPAAHNDWLLPHSRHGKALPLADKWLSTTNRCDESLWRYERLEKCGNPPALGFAGFTGRGQLPAELQNRWEEWEVSNLVGSTHNYHPYMHSPWIAEQTARCVLWK
ncbi:MAG TPA: hypothetical protein VMP01_05740 [Pirellulaceae bacterium]|nr:hypothetical protein [Pirellulaceae bacterium]